MDLLYNGRCIRQLRPEHYGWNFALTTYKSQGWNVLDIPSTFTKLTNKANHLKACRCKASCGYCVSCTQSDLTLTPLHPTGLTLSTQPAKFRRTIHPSAGDSSTSPSKRIPGLKTHSTEQNHLSRRYPEGAHSRNASSRARNLCQAPGPLLGGSWVVVSGVISRGLIALLITTHDPASTSQRITPGACILGSKHPR